MDLTETNDAKKMSDLEALETIYVEVAKRFQYESERTKHLDDKASNIIGFVGIITGLISTIGGFLLGMPQTPFEIFAAVLFFDVLILLVISFVCGLAAYHIKKFTVVPDAYFLIGAYEKEDKERVLRDLNDNYAVAIEENLKLNDKKVEYVKSAMYALFVGILLVPFFVLLTMLG